MHTMKITRYVYLYSYRSEWKDGQVSLEQVKQSIAQGKEDLNDVNFPKGAPAVVYFNPKKGLAAGIDINSAFPDPNNPFFDPEQSQEDILFIAGGVIPDEDIPGLKEKGVAEIFTPGTPTHTIIDYIQTAVKQGGKQ